MTASNGNPSGLSNAVTGAATAGWKYGTAGTGAQSCGTLLQSLIVIRLIPHALISQISKVSKTLNLQRGKVSTTQLFELWDWRRNYDGYKEYGLAS